MPPNDSKVLLSVLGFQIFFLSLCYLRTVLCNGFRGRQQDIAVLGQFSAEVITSSLYPYKKCSCIVMKRISIKFHQKALNHKMFLVVFAGIALKLEKVCHIFSCFNPCLSFQALAKDNWKWFQCLYIVLNSNIKTLGHYFWNSIDAKTCFSF